MLPEIFTPGEKGKLEDWFSPIVCTVLRKEFSDPRWKPEQLKDEATIRYIYSSVLESFGIACPHPWRRSIPGGGPQYQKSFECKMCRAWIIYNDESGRKD